MSTESKTRQKREDHYQAYVNLDEAGKKEWSKTAKSLETSNNQDSYKATVKEWWIEGEEAYVSFYVPYFDEIFYGVKDAELYPSDSSEFEKFLGSYGYSLQDPNVLPEGSEIRVEPKRSNKGIYFEPIKKQENSRGFFNSTVASGALFGLFPLINYIVIFECFRDMKRSPPSAQFTTENNIWFITGAILTSTISTFFLGMLYYLYLDMTAI